MLYVDFNEMVERNLVLLSAHDSKRDINGDLVIMVEGASIAIYMHDLDDDGEVDNLVATGIVERNTSKGWSANAKWCCRIDSNGIRHESETLADIAVSKHILATVEIPIVMAFDELALEIGDVIGGLVFTREETGRFEEVPAFIVSQGDMDFKLFGVPEGESSDAYILQLSAETRLHIQDFRQTILEFVSDFLGEKEVNSRGYLDYSDELAAALCSIGINAHS